MSSPSSPETAPALLAIHLDLVGGLAGDMFVAALLDALPALAPPLFAALAAVQPAGEGAPALTTTQQGGLRAARFGLTPAPRPRSLARPALAAAHGSRYGDLRDGLAGAALDDATKRESLALLDLLGSTEAEVHGIALADVHFHELADWDSLLDVVAAGFIAARLRDAHWSASAVPLGGGTVKTAHGVLPVPAPATARLLVGYPCRDDGIGGERVTPTGAAILRHLVPAAQCAAPRPGGTLVALGLGAGTRVLPGLPNVARALVFRRAVGAQAGPSTDTVATIGFDVDDMTGEEIALAAERLRTVDGVLDVSVGTRIGKKGRPLSDFRVLARTACVEGIAEACFAQTSTLGLRLGETQRRVLARSQVDAELRVKVAQRPDGTRTAKSEHDDVRDADTLAERRRLGSEAEQRALRERG